MSSFDNPCHLPTLIKISNTSEQQKQINKAPSAANEQNETEKNCSNYNIIYNLSLKLENHYGESKHHKLKNRQSTFIFKRTLHH